MTAMPVLPIHPGEHLAGELTALDMSAAAPARRLQVPANRNTAPDQSVASYIKTLQSMNQRLHKIFYLQ